MEVVETEIGVSRQIIYHLLPGILVTIAYTVFGSYFYSIGYPSVLGFYLAFFLVLFPFQIVLPIYLERRKKPHANYREIFLFREKQPIWQLAILILGSFLWAGLVFLITGSKLVDPIRETFFAWVPDWYEFGSYLFNNQLYSRAMKIWTWVLGIVFGAFIGPTIEELYFRSYLLPRMTTFRGFAPLVGGILMVLYHFWSPWLFVVRVIAILPMVYAVWWKQNVYIGIIAHCLLNLVGDAILVIPLVFS